MFEDLNGRVAVVTGGARGLGFSMARALARLGVHVALLDMLAGVGDSATTLAADGRGWVSPPISTAWWPCSARRPPVT